MWKYIWINRAESSKKLLLHPASVLCFVPGEKYFQRKVYSLLMDEPLYHRQLEEGDFYFNHMAWFLSDKFKSSWSFVFPLNFQNICLPETRNNGAGFIRVATALSESSSIHSDALYHLTRDMSGLGLDPMSYSILEPDPYKDEPYKDEPWAEETQSLLKVTKRW